MAPSPPAAPSPATAPSPPVAVRSNPRYLYLSRRLRERQITMEEATELFAILEAAMAMPAAVAPVPPPPPARRAGVPGLAVSVSDDQLALGLLALGVGAGLLAALGARARGERPESRAARPGSPAKSA